MTRPSVALLAEMLKEMGHEVCSVATTQADAVRAALRETPDLMIVDANLGSGSGIAAVETISITRPVPHIFMSGDRIAAARSLSFVLLKPFTQRALTGAIVHTMQMAG